MTKQGGMTKKFDFSIYKAFGVVVAGLINAVGVILFLSPANVLDGGISGLSVLLSKITPVSVAVFIILINIPFFVLGYKKNGLSFIVYSIIAIASYSLFSFIFQHFGVDSAMSKQLGNDMFICSIFGGIISGIGSGLTIKFGGAIDGIEVLSVLFAKKLSLTVGQFVMIFNTIMYICACFIFSNFQIGLYSIVTYAVGLKAVDFVVDGFDKGKACIIITNKSEEMGDAISSSMGRGITVLNAQGYYSGEGKTMMYCVVNRFEIGKITSIVSKIDSNAFMTINDISDIFGGAVKFKNILARKKLNKKKNANTSAADIDLDKLSKDIQTLNENMINQINDNQSDLTKNNDNIDMSNDNADKNLNAEKIDDIIIEKE